MSASPTHCCGTCSEVKPAEGFFKNRKNKTGRNTHECHEPVAWMHTKIEGVVVAHSPADLKLHPDRWMPLFKAPTPCQTCHALALTVMMDQTAHDTTPPAAEREACAKVCELIAREIDDTNGLATYCAKAIRMRGEK